MTDREEPTDVTLRDIANGDQRITEITETAGRTSMYYRLLTGNGVPEMPAARMAEAYNTMLLMRHFDVEAQGLAMNYFIGDTGVEE